MSSDDSPIPREVTVHELIMLLAERGYMLNPRAIDYGSHQGGYWNGALQALALAMYAPEYAQARFAEMAASTRDPEFFRSFQRDKALEIVEEFPI